MMIKTWQRHVCDGQQLHIECNDDYTLELLAVHETILADGDQQQHDEPAGGPPGGRAAANSGQPAEAGDQAEATGDADASKPKTKDNKVITGGQLQQWAASSGNQTAAAAPADSNSLCRPLSSGQLEARRRLWSQRQQQLDGRATGNANGTAAQRLGLCNQRSHSDELQAKIHHLVQAECHLKHSCSLDLRLDENKPAQIGTAAPTTSAGVPTSSGLVNLIHEDECPLNRKLIELVYKCRPPKVKNRFVCRGSQLNLECADDKLLVIAQAAYGHWLEDKRIHEKCSALVGGASASNQSGTDSSGGPLTRLGSPAATTRNCFSRTSAVYALSPECSLKRQCRFDVTPASFDETHCAPSQAEYLKLMYVCVSEQVINKNSTLVAQLQQHQQPAKQQQQQALSPPNEQQQRQQAASTPFTSANISSSSLLNSSPPIPQPSDSNANGFISPPLGPVGLLNDGGGAGDRSGGSRSTQIEAQDSDLDQLPPISSRVLTVISADPQLSSTHPLYWTGLQRAKFVWLRHQREVVLVAPIVLISLIVLGLAIRVYRQRPGGGNQTDGGSRKSRQSTNANPSSASSNASSSSSAASSSAGSGCSSASSHLMVDAGKCFGGLGGGGGGGGAHHHHQMPRSAGLPGMKHSNNSCSESCFSLDDYNCFSSTQTYLPLQLSGTDSPALVSRPTPPADESQHQRQAQQHQQHQQQQQHHHHHQQQTSTATARPKLWSFYANERVNHSTSLRLGSAFATHGHHHHSQQQQHLGTMRHAPRQAFAGLTEPSGFQAPQQLETETGEQAGGASQQQVSSLDAHHAHAQLAHQQTLGHQPGESAAAAYLLALAHRQQQTQVQPQLFGEVNGGDMPAPASWCPAHANQLSQQQTMQTNLANLAINQQQLGLLTLNVADLGQQQQTGSSPGASVAPAATAPATTPNQLQRAQHRQQQLFLGPLLE